MHAYERHDTRGTAMRDTPMRGNPYGKYVHERSGYETHAHERRTYERHAYIIQP
jgi:hypothetical protein